MEIQTLTVGGALHVAKIEDFNLVSNDETTKKLLAMEFTNEGSFFWLNAGATYKNFFEGRMDDDFMRIEGTARTRFLSVTGPLLYETFGMNILTGRPQFDRNQVISLPEHALVYLPSGIGHTWIPQKHEEFGKLCAFHASRRYPEVLELEEDQRELRIPALTFAAVAA